MLEELKTLKDIEKDFLQNRSQHFPPTIKKILKQEVIKWIKAIAKPQKIDLRLIEFQNKGANEYELTTIQNIKGKDELAIAQIGWIMHFFNIKKEDFK